MKQLKYFNQFLVESTAASQSTGNAPTEELPATNNIEYTVGNIYKLTNNNQKDPRYKTGFFKVVGVNGNILETYIGSSPDDISTEGKPIKLHMDKLTPEQTIEQV